MLEASISLHAGTFPLSVELAADVGVTVIFGRSGSGKTSLLDAIAGLRRPEAGRIVIGGTTVFDAAGGIDLPPEQRAVGYVFQDARLLPHLSVHENLVYGLKRVRDREVVFQQGEIVELLELGPLLARRPAGLSGGEAQRVAIGRALLRQPGALLMDEPLSNLDVTSREQLIPFIARLADRISIPIVYVSHGVEEVLRLADRVALMSSGEVVACGPADEVMSRGDLGPLTGRYEAGAMIETTIVEHEADYGLSRLSCGHQDLYVPALDMPLGAPIRIRIRSRDIAIALERPENSSFVNILEGTLRAIDGEPDASQVNLQIDVGVPLIARITRKSLEKLALGPGQHIYALIKSVAIDRRSLGLRGERNGPESV